MVAVAADALDVFKFCISFLDSFLLGFVDLGFCLVFMMRRIHRLRVRSMQFESKSFLGRVRLSRDWNGQSMNDRDVVVSIGAEIGETFEEIFPVLVDLAVSSMR